MQFHYRSNRQPARRAPAFRASPRAGKLLARRLSMESLESRALLAVVALTNETTPSRGIVATQAIYDDAGLDWTGAGFDDSAWTESTPGGPNGIGAPIGAGKYGLFASISAASMVQTSNTAFLRIPFTVANAAAFASLTLNMRFDDGFIAYLNGQEVMRQNVAGTDYPLWPVPASQSVAADATTFTTFDISAHRGALVSGANILAIRGFDRPQAGAFPVGQDFVVQATLSGVIPDTPPTANNDSVVFQTTAPTLPALPTTITVLANDTAGTYPLNPASVQIVTPPTKGAAVANANGTISYTPQQSHSGVDTFTYRVRDTSPDPSPGGMTTPVTFVTTTAPHRRLVPTAAIAATWTGSAAFDDSLWTVGTGGIGYERDAANTYDPYFLGDTEAAMYNAVVGAGGNNTAYVRYPFTVTNPAEVVGLRLRMRFDDGFVAHINGVQVAAVNAPVTPAWNSAATAANPDANAVVQQEFVIPLAGLNLRTGAGANILAIQGLNEAVTSSDFLIQPELIADTSPLGLWSNVATVTVDTRRPGPTAVDDVVPLIQVVEQQSAGVDVDVLANDTPGTSGAAIRRDTVAIATPPANGVIDNIDPATGVITYRPNAGFYGDDVFSYTVRDNFPVGGTQAVVFKARGTNWKYLDDGTDQGTAWTGVSFNDSAWPSGLAELGYSDAPVTAIRCTTAPVCAGNEANKFITYYFRSTFQVDDPSTVQVLNVLASYDDGAVIYINGTEVARSANMPAGPINYLTLANPDHEGGNFEQLASLMPAQLTMLRPGTNVIAVEIHQNAATSSDLTFDVELAGTIDAPTGNLSNTANVHIHVNAPPVAVNDTINVGPFGTQGALPSSITFNPLLNDSDPDNSPSTPPGSFGVDPRTLVITQQPSRGTVAVNPTTGAITFTATSNMQRPETLTFRYTVRDYQNSLSNQATVTVNVVVAAPNTVNDAAVTPEGQPVTINVLANDTRADLLLAPGTLVVTSQPANGTAVKNTATNTITYTPNPGFRDQFDTFTYTVADLSGNVSRQTTVTVDVFSLAIARVDGFALDQGATSVTIPIADILVNDYWPTASFQPRVVIVPNSWTNGEEPVINSVAGVQQSITFKTLPGATGVGGFTYYLADGVANPTRPNSNNARVSIALGAINVSGTVYVDVNRSGSYDGGEQLVPGATIVLTRAGDPTFRVQTTTGTNPSDPATYGKYFFASTSAGVLPPDTYTITQIQPALYLDFPTGAVNSHTALLTASDNPGYDFLEWTVNPQFFATLANYGGGFLASQQPVSLSAGSIVVSYDQGWNGPFTARATYDPALGPVSVKLYNSAGSVVANSATNPGSTAGNSVLTYPASPSQKLVLVVSGTNPDVSIDAPNLGTIAGDTTPPFVYHTALSSTTWSTAFAANLAANMLGSSGYNVAAGETLPWKNLDRITMRFTEPVAVGHNDLRLWGVNVADYRQQVGIQSFHYDPLTFTATWTLTQPIAADQLRVGLSDAVRDTWGNRVGGAGYEMLFNVLPGAIPSAGENPLGQMLARQFTTIGHERYAPHFDLDGNGVINFVDAIALRNALGATLPLGTPGNGTTSTPSPQAPAAVVVSASRGSDGVRQREAEAPLAATRTVVRATRAAAVDAAVTAAANDTSASTSLSNLRARRAARSADRAFASLDGSL